MKKFYILFSASCVAVSAVAAEREMLAPQKGVVDAVRVSNVAAPLRSQSLAIDKKAVAFGAKKISTRADATESEVSEVYFRPADNVMAFGMNPEGSGYSGIGFASPYGTVDFWNFSLGVKDMQWSYSELNDYEIGDQTLVWNPSTSDAIDLSVKSGVGMFDAPVLTGKDGAKTLESQGCAVRYYCGAAPWYFMGEDGMDLGVTFYQNTFLRDAEGNSGVPLAEYAYFPGGHEDGFESNGVSSSWYEALGGVFKDQTVTDLEMQDITVIIPEMPSSYLMSQGWIWMQVSANAATQLISYIYPIDEEGKISDNPIAIGYAAIPKGNTAMPVFYYNPLDENGDEIEGDVIIKSGVAVSIEGFNGNAAIDNMMTLSGFYPISVDMYMNSPYEDVIKSPDLYVGLSCKLDGEYAAFRMAYTATYYTDDTRKNVSQFCYSQFAMDAVFPWILSVNGEESVTLPLSGGEVDVDINAFYYNINQMIEDDEYVVTSSDWINVAFGDSDPQTGNTTMTVAVDATDADRVGSVEISGLGLTYSLKVVQGEDNAVSVIAVDKNAEYFDLQGRRVANPEKGIYIKKTANKAEKVLF
ncbi:MAG: BACON domain-containing protein [Muribaculaceae bacterium]|nr:BACON domain-containing protein [Muribaculaceae bacterium]